MACDQHGRESATIIQNESIENQQQSSILEDEDEEDPFAEFAWVTGHDVDGFSSGQNDDASSEENKDDDDSHDNTLKLISTVSDSSSQKPHRGAPKMQKQKRKAHLYTDALYAGKFGVGTRVFVNRLKYAAYKVTLTRVKEYLKVL